MSDRNSRFGDRYFHTSASHSNSNQLNDLERFRGLIESTDEWFWEVDEKLCYTYSSPQIFKMLGYTPEEVIGKRPYDFMTNEEAHRIGDIVRPLIKQRRNIHLLENVNIHKDGNKVYLETNGRPVFDQDNRFLGYRGVDRDISVRKMLEGEKINLLDALGQIHEAALILNSEGEIVYLNQAFYDLFGYSPSEILHKPISKLEPHPEENATTPDEVLKALNEKGYWNGETKRRRKNGRYITVFLKAKAIRDEDGNVTGYLGTYFNLKPYKKAEKALRKSLISTIKAISLTVEKRDPYTYGHQNRVTQLALAIAAELDLSKDFARGLQMGALIHDIGKIYIPSEILNRPGRITEHEFGMIKTHSQVGYDIIRDIEFPWPVADMLLQHHERLDGSGYPSGLKKEEILQEARIICVADVFEAMTSHRPYRPALDKEVGLEELEKNRKKLYDPGIVDCCVKLIRGGSFSFA